MAYLQDNRRLKKTFLKWVVIGAFLPGVLLSTMPSPIFADHAVEEALELPGRVNEPDLDEDVILHHHIDTTLAGIVDLQENLIQQAIQSSSPDLPHNMVLEEGNASRPETNIDIMVDQLLAV